LAPVVLAFFLSKINVSPLQNHQFLEINANSPNGEVIPKSKFDQGEYVGNHKEKKTALCFSKHSFLKENGTSFIFKLLFVFLI